ncbi:PQQ-binding-like beta-propeller repeat protein [Halogeometricum borinquense]|uniref:PQQ-binding-like beta-propeller repeat protein n=1 Tax=Halogeometricum borinquense TaxID=60847 RepID=A0A6C0UL30_9EURY|nr:PQQ-binding-like beta-propeller repeat protein [Halogeometricum borinquense]QIB75957.1 PQQ-binding-like beta-propeller repeat protein [Halogeometricum borinquense]QIQ75460.1 PQQ-binding-like beta-propeller repeat protein [Halogeometricum borinquense]
MPDWSRRDILLALGVTGTAGGGWYLAEEPHCASPLEPVWTYHGDYWGPVVEAENALLVPEGYGTTGGDRNRLAALNYHGQAEWTTVSEGGGFGVPAVHENRVYVGTGDDTVRALDAATGRIEWTYDAGGVEEYGGGAWGQPLVADGRVYVGISHSNKPEPDPSDESQYTHRVVALDSTDGTELWATEVTAMVGHGPALASDIVVSGSEDSVLRGFDPETGDVRWTVSLPGKTWWQPVFVNESLVFATTETVAKVNAAEGTVQQTKNPLDEMVSFDHDEDTVYLGGTSGRVVALTTTPEAETPEWSVKWEYDADISVGAIAAGDAGVFVVDQSGYLHRVTDEGRRGNRVPLVESQYEDRCGWMTDSPDGKIESAHLDSWRSWLYVSTRRWVRPFDVGDV